MPVWSLNRISPRLLAIWRRLTRAGADIKLMQGNRNAERVAEMDYETISPSEFGAALSGLGLNLLVRDVRAEAAFLAGMFGMSVHRLGEDYAIMGYHGQVLQLHADHTYASHPLLGLVPETPPRGAGASIHLFQSDPDSAAAKAGAMGGLILQPPSNKPHGLRECCILCGNGYAWVASRPLTPEERQSP